MKALSRTVGKPKWRFHSPRQMTSELTFPAKSMSLQPVWLIVLCLEPDVPLLAELILLHVMQDRYTVAGLTPGVSF